jgi:D-alanyl-D-alanine carboxypeptidase
VLEREIFGPLRLRRTSFEEDPDLPGAFAHGYYVFGGLWQERGVYEPSSFWGAGNLASSARDVGRFFRELLSGALLEDPQLQEMKTLYPTPSDAYLQGYGLGLYRNTFGGCAQEWWGHDGQLQGYASVAVNAEDASRQVVILVNSSSFPWAEWDMGPDLQAVFDSAWCGLFR